MIITSDCAHLSVPACRGLEPPRLGTVGLPLTVPAYGARSGHGRGTVGHWCPGRSGAKRADRGSPTKQGGSSVPEACPPMGARSFEHPGDQVWPIQPPPEPPKVPIADGGGGVNFPGYLFFCQVVCIAVDNLPITIQPYCHSARIRDGARIWPAMQQVAQNADLNRRNAVHQTLRRAANPVRRCETFCAPTASRCETFYALAANLSKATKGTAQGGLVTRCVFGGFPRCFWGFRVGLWVASAKFC